MIAETSIKAFRSSDLLGSLHLITPALLAGAGVFLSLMAIWSPFYFAGQLLLGFFFFQCFILLHETGHFSYFGSRRLNKLFGHFFGFVSFIPLSSWIEIHNLHHRWTGYRDKDPTTEGTVHPSFGAATRFLVNFSWLFWIPLFTIGYRIGNYWNIIKLKKHLSASTLPVVYANQILQLGAYAVLFALFGSWIVRNLLLGYVFSLMISDLFILSQHSHIEIPLAGANEVKPLRYVDQLPYTRSLAFFKYIGRLLYFNFNLHELHHAYPGLPAYHMDKVHLETPNKVTFFSYLRDAKGMSGIDFVFNTSARLIGKRPGR
jgi:acyl-lipid omega-6 desaturase (Delta-12 desaturase)